MVRDSIVEILKDAPDNWGKWGPDDEIGAVNYLTPGEVLRGVGTVENGSVFPLGSYIGHPEGDPCVPGESGANHYITLDKGHYESGKIESNPGGQEWASDILHLPVHGTTTHVDAPAHVWYDDTIYNKFDANTTKGGLGRCGIENVAEHGIVGRGVLLDVARHRGVDHLDRGDHISLDELKACANEQGVELHPRDVLIIRTGVLEKFYESGQKAYDEAFVECQDGTCRINEPGPTYTDKFVDWIHEMETPMLATDTITAEQTISGETGTSVPLHPALLRDQGVLLGELTYLSDLAKDCAEDGKYDFLFVAAPLKIVGGTGSPINPLAIK